MRWQRRACVIVCLPYYMHMLAYLVSLRLLRMARVFDASRSIFSRVFLQDFLYLRIIIAIVKKISRLWNIYRYLYSIRGILLKYSFSFSCRINKMYELWKITACENQLLRCSTDSYSYAGESTLISRAYHKRLCYMTHLSREQQVENSFTRS